ncbi:filamentous hemagglutinin N-terminal domain-containing protein [Mastigocoleus sp. MO_188.B34]|uniref:two-partner secretion domain-containing protein n=1 Tax=Mastigocoleus sp. MO_188.B34 TaxID=3036635 RepID=UPI002602FCAC|nr:filamentous hemagglutinin N-terminal domain-containing protein [Mastigocoleus sp. MO_188.B34]MDJ0693063.1 filamentous hemagglutinin N-terminal domain-containing protein [Mastigocoleus sp. MO_188.B34]
MNTFWNWFQDLGITISSVMLSELLIVAFYANSASAQIIPDTTLPNNSRVTRQGNVRIIEGGTNLGSNLFHSFEEFSISNGVTADFKNAINIQNIITRVTGNSVSNIDGKLRANGTANLFLINPNGIIFGPNASLNIGGSFVGSTASSINFAKDIEFSATEPKTKSLLTVNVPIGLQFGAKAAPIDNQSQASPDGAINIFEKPVGLQVPTSETLALLGGDITLQGGNLTASEGRIELGSVAENSLVSLDLTNQGWVFEYEGVQEFKKIRFIRRNFDGSLISSIVDVSGQGGGNIRLQGHSIELIGEDVLLLSGTTGNKDGGDLKITAKQLIIRDGAQVNSFNLGEGKGGNVIVNSSESVALINTTTNRSTVLSAASFATGDAGNLTINTTKLLVQDGAVITVNSGGKRDSRDTPFIQGTGRGGNLIINASESVVLIGTSADGFSASRLLTSTQGSGGAGNLKINTKELIVRDGAEINLNSQIPDPENVVLGEIESFGEAGSFTVDANSILLDKGKISANTVGGGGNITLNSPLSILRNNSSITTNAEGTNIPGGNITINAKNGFIIGSGNSDITANSRDFRGGNIRIFNSQGIFGIEPRDRENPNTSDITATGATDRESGTITIDNADAEPDQNLLKVNDNLVDVSQLINRDFCALRGKSHFIIIGRGGLPPSPNTVLDRQNLWEDWRLNSVPRETAQRKGKEEIIENNIENNITVSETVNKPINKIVQAQRAVINKAGEVMLVADAATPPSFQASGRCE